MVAVAICNALLSSCVRSRNYLFAWEKRVSRKWARSALFNRGKI